RAVRTVAVDVGAAVQRDRGRVHSQRRPAGPDPGRVLLAVALTGGRVLPRPPPPPGEPRTLGVVDIDHPVDVPRKPGQGRSRVDVATARVEAPMRAHRA